MPYAYLVFNKELNNQSDNIKKEKQNDDVQLGRLNANTSIYTESEKRRDVNHAQDDVAAFNAQPMKRNTNKYKQIINKNTNNTKQEALLVL